MTLPTRGWRSTSTSSGLNSVPEISTMSGPRLIRLARILRSIRHASYAETYPSPLHRSAGTRGHPPRFRHPEPNSLDDTKYTRAVAGATVAYVPGFQPRPPLGGPKAPNHRHFGPMVRPGPARRGCPHESSH